MEKALEIVRKELENVEIQEKRIEEGTAYESKKSMETIGAIKLICPISSTSCGVLYCENPHTTGQFLANFDPPSNRVGVARRRTATAPKG